MPISCPKCSKQLPAVETLKYRFCPHCGAEIPAEPKKLDNVLLTIPPDLSKRQPKQMADVLSPQTDENASTTKSFNDQTIEPQQMVKRSRPKINPPDTPPPSSFFRISSAEKTHSISSGEKVPPKKVIKKQSPTKTRSSIIVILVILAIIILVLGGLFTF
jgi:DNA-directed RNA polymerase subunit RPC12/RpoP